MLGIFFCSTVSRNKVVSLKLSKSWVDGFFFSSRTIDCQIKWSFSLSLFYPCLFIRLTLT